MWCFFLIGVCMSLAISVLVKPSQRLKLYLLLVLGVVCSALMYVAIALQKDLSFYSSLIIIVSLLLVLWSVQNQLLGVVPYRLEIDCEGRMLVSDVHPSLKEQDFRAIYVNSPIVVWSRLILLQVYDESGSRQGLLIFRDAVSEDEFRQLRVALIYLAQRRRSLIDKNQMSEGNF